MPPFTVVVPWRATPARQRIWDWNRQRWAALVPGAELVVADSGDDQFSRGKSRNDGVAKAQHEIVVLADADTVVVPALLFSAVDAVWGGGQRWVLPYGLPGRDQAGYYNLTRETTDELLSSSPAAVVEPPTVWEHRLTSHSGMIVTTKSLFVGYDTGYTGWGWEDTAFYESMRRAHGPVTRIDHGYVCHMWHERGTEVFGSVEEQANKARFDALFPRWRDDRRSTR